MPIDIDDSTQVEEIRKSIIRLRNKIGSLQTYTIEDMGFSPGSPISRRLYELFQEADQIREDVLELKEAINH